MMRTRWRLGSKRRLVATIEWLRWLPNDGFFPQMEQILDMRAPSVAVWPKAARSRNRIEMGGRFLLVAAVLTSAVAATFVATPAVAAPRCASPDTTGEPTGGRSQSPAAPTYFAPDFPALTDEAWGYRVGGFGGLHRRAKLRHTPVVFVHGNQADAQNWLDVMLQFQNLAGYSMQEMYALSYSGLGNY
jgi:lipase (class 2)